MTPSPSGSPAGWTARGTPSTCAWWAADSSNTFVGIERFSGRVAGRRGSFALTAHGITTSEGLVRGVWRVVAGSATGELRRLRGRGAFTACRHTDGAWRSEDRSTHWYEPEEPAAATTAAAALPPCRSEVRGG